MRRSTKNLISCFFWVGLSILMLVCIVINIYNNSLYGIVLCSVAALMNISNVISRFKDYKYVREWEEEYFKACMEKNCPEEIGFIFE